MTRASAFGVMHTLPCRLALLVRLSLLACAAAAGAHAAQPYVTDDARLLPEGSCQLELGKRVLRGSREAWFLPACNAFGNIELTLGANRSWDVDGARATDLVVQAKGLFRELKANDYGLGWVANAEFHRHPLPDEKRIGSMAASAIFSHSFFDDVLFFHANAGAKRLRDTGATAATWGLAGEFNIVNERFAVLAEVADTTRSRRGYQAGLWFALVPDRLELDVSVGGEARDFRRTRYWTVGLRVITPPFLK